MFITFLLIFIMIVPTYEFLRKYKNFSFIFFIVTPILLANVWINQDNMDWFKWAKIYSVSLLSFLINLTRYKNYHKSTILFNIIYILSAINILEAVIRDITTFDSASVINIFIGICLIFTFLIKPSKISVSDKYIKDFYTPNLTLSWITCYNIWDWVYIYGEYPQFAMRHIFVLGIPFIMELFRPNTWLQIRAFTLTTYLIFSFTFSDYLIKIFPVMTYNHNVALILAVFNLFILTYYALTIHKKLKIKIHKNILSERTIILFNKIIKR